MYWLMYDHDSRPQRFTFISMCPGGRNRRQVTPFASTSQRRRSHLVVSQASIDRARCSVIAHAQVAVFGSSETKPPSQQQICGVDWQMRRVWSVGWLAVGSGKRKRNNPAIATTATPALRRQCAEPLFSPLRQGARVARLR